MLPVEIKHRASTVWQCRITAKILTDCCLFVGLSAYSFDFSKWNAWSIGLKSGDWLGHCRIFIFFYLQNVWVAFAVCFGIYLLAELSAWGWVIFCQAVELGSNRWGEAVSRTSLAYYNAYMDQSKRLLDAEPWAHQCVLFSQNVPKCWFGHSWCSCYLSDWICFVFET